MVEAAMLWNEPNNLTFCFTPEHAGERAHHTSPPRRPEELAEFCGRMVRRCGS